jgi:predicted ATP-dependent Lon-type protease
MTKSVQTVGLAVTGGLNLGGSIETIFNPVAVVEIAIEKGANSILMPISSRRQLNELPPIWQPRSPSSTISTRRTRC